MKIYQLSMDEKTHASIKRSAAEVNESIKDFILNATKERIKTVEYFRLNRELQKDVKNRDSLDFLEVESIHDIFK